MKTKINPFIVKLFQRKSAVTDRQVALANMLVTHIQVAAQKPTAECKK